MADNVYYYYNPLFIVVTIIGLVIILAIIVATASYVNDQTPNQVLPTVTNTVTLNSNLGAAPYGSFQMEKKYAIATADSKFLTQNACSQQAHTTWENGKCVCVAPFYGDNCSREKHANNYYGVGSPDLNSIQLNILEKTTASAKSFNKNKSNDKTSEQTCSEKCDNNADCIGFIYRDSNSCLLLQDKVIVPTGGDIPYSHVTDPTLYMKSSDDLYFEGRIFIGAFPLAIPPRGWLIKENDVYSQIIPNTINKIKFYPTYVKKVGDYTGIYSLQPFTRDIADILVEKGDNFQVYIHKSGEELKVPIDWQYRSPIYVMYI